MPNNFENPSKDDNDATTATATNTTTTLPVPFSRRRRRQIHTVIDHCLSQLTRNYHDLKPNDSHNSATTTNTNTANHIGVPHDLRLRRATQVDIPSMLELVRDLAVYEKSSRDSLTVTFETYLKDAFGNNNNTTTHVEEQQQEEDEQNPLFYSILLESRTPPLPTKDHPHPHPQNRHPDKPHEDMESSSTIIGQALWYIGYSTTTSPQIGQFLYLEDLYIQPTSRGMGGGQLLMQALSHIGQALNCTRLEWLVLDWNTPSIDFYKKVVGATMVEGYLTRRFNSEGLQQFLTSRETNTSSVAMTESDHPHSRSHDVAISPRSEKSCIPTTVIHHCIQKTNRLVQERNENNTLRIRRAHLEDAVTVSSFLPHRADWKHDHADRRSFEECFHLLQDLWKNDMNPYFHGLILENMEDQEKPAVVIGVAIWYVGYSSRGGKLVFLENMSMTPEAQTMGGEDLFFYTLADIASQWQCTRLEWRTYDECHKASSNMHDTRRIIGATTLHNCITMRLDKEGMENFCNTWTH